MEYKITPDENMKRLFFNHMAFMKYGLQNIGTGRVFDLMILQNP
ncbi:hypothetical protein [Chryseobacterium herbae]|uniref:Uncharacterized protein n=1 Tax=Chryseobacterium herbae TaxID=2976476 RepID=A0ABT2INS3_9FLAO|nr:hypothetical protein [Chryseobacterium sp. pc1-10]MCT2560412.1 hypothetical protein [Chryseobacterium sp. pc1-10]